MRYFYYYPTFDKPSGGNKQLRLQAQLLRDLGAEVMLLRDEVFFTRKPHFDDNLLYSIDVPIADVPFERAMEFLRPEDVLILPEVKLEDSLRICESWQVRLAVNNQNGFYGLRYGPSKKRVKERIEFVIANAPYVAALSSQYYGIRRNRIFHVPHWVVRPPFEIVESQYPTLLAVNYMPRKMPELVQQVRDSLLTRYPDIPWIPIDGVPESEVAQKLRVARVFFAAQDLEGCPLTALEAMCCNAIVAGYPGTARFSHPYANRFNGFWAPDRDVPLACRNVEQAIELAKSGGDKYLAMIAAGHETARWFARPAVLSALQEVLSTTQLQSYDQRHGPRCQLNWQGRYQATRILYDSDRLGATANYVGAAIGKIRRLSKIAWSK